MNWDQIAGEWKQLKGELKSKWAKLTDEDLAKLEAKKDQLVGKIQERYGVMRDAAERQVDEWMSSRRGRQEQQQPPPAEPPPRR
jgi:uncharacterized protein YjbJ (UPF0337 family)